MNGWIDPIKHGTTSRQYLGHTFRYKLASGFLQPSDVVIDVACGVGYGSKIMSYGCKTVTGYDVDTRALEIASARYPDILFTKVDLCDVEFVPIDVAVSFETLEHLEKPEKFIASLKNSAQRLIILSTPVVPTKHRNKHHLHDFTEQQVLEMILDNKWILWEHVIQGPYLILVAYRRNW